MQTKVSVEFLLTPDEVATLQDDVTLGPLLMRSVASGANPKWNNELERVSYRFLSKCSHLISEDVIKTLIGMGIIVLIRGGIWIEIPTSEADDVVDASWPDAKNTTTDEEEVTTEIDRLLSEYSTIIQGENGKSLLRCGYKPQNSSAFYAPLPENCTSNCPDTVDTPEIIARYKAKWPTADLYFLNSLEDWKSLNVTPSV